MFKPLQVGGHCGKGIHLLVSQDDIYISPAGNRQCRQCKKVNGSKWVDLNPEHARSLRNNWYVKNKAYALRQCKQWKAANKDRNRLTNRQSHLKRMFGLSLDDQEYMMSKQSGMCAICPRKLNNAPLVDHDHTTGKVRGLLCRRCNTGLGQFNDSPDLLKKALLYLGSSSLS